MQNKRILVLAGTGLARVAATRLNDAGYHVISSFAGVTSKPILPLGEIRTGGFGGVKGLKAYLEEQKIDVLIDATHAFAAQISSNAYAACKALNLPLMRLAEQPWASAPDWINVNTLQEALAALPVNAKVAVTIGRKEIAGFFERQVISGRARMIESLEIPAPLNWEVTYRRPPFSLADELEWLKGMDYLVSKNAGGMLPAKLQAAEMLGIKIIMISQPPKSHVPCFFTVEDLLGSLAATS